MTRAQADQVLAAGRARIAEWRARLLPVAGSGVVITGREVALEPRAPREEPLPPEDTRQLWIWGRLTVTVNGETEQFDWVRASYINDDGQLVNNVLGFWEGTQLVASEEQTRSVVVELLPRWHRPGQVLLEEGTYRGRVRIVLDERDFTPGHEEVTLRQYTLTLGRNGDSQSFANQDPGLFTELRPSSLTRI